MRIALDAMGGDYAPEEVVKGAVEAARACPAEIILVGRSAAIEAELGRLQAPALSLTVVNADDVIEMHESPATAVRAKRRSSLVVGINLVREGEASAFVSAGNSGAVMAAALLILGRVRGIERPALSVILPGLNGPWMLIDAGANVDCKASYLQQFAVMGSVYCEHVLGVASPKVGLLSNGEEDTKGSALVVDGHRLLREATVNFVGNVEGRDLPMGDVNVVVTDGFVGNVVLKTAEGVGEVLLRMVQQEVQKSFLSKMAALALLPAFRRVKRRVDYAEYGGGVLLGVEGVCVIGHGRSKAKAIRNAILMAHRAAEENVVGAIGNGIAALRVDSAPKPS